MVESTSLLRRHTSKGYQGFKSLPLRFFIYLDAELFYRNVFAFSGMRYGKLSEWLNERDWKSRVRESVPGVRIPHFP